MIQYTAWRRPAATPKPHDEVVLVARFWNSDGVQMPSLYRHVATGQEICVWNYHLAARREDVLTAAGAPSIGKLNALTEKATRRARRVLEPKLAAVLEPILDTAADTAAANFSSTATSFYAKPVTAAGSVVTKQAKALQSAVDEYRSAEDAVAAARKTGDAKLIANAIRREARARRRLTALLHPNEPPPPEASQPGEQPGAAAQAPVQVQEVEQPSQERLIEKTTERVLEGPEGPKIREELLREIEAELERPSPGIIERVADKLGVSVGEASDIIAAEGIAEAVAEAEARAAGTISTWSAPAPSEVLDTEKLADTIRATTAPVREAMVSTVMSPTMQAVGLSFDVTDPLAGKVLAQSASQVVGISETTRADVMKVIHDAYEQGLSIPDTATAIQAVMKEATPARARLIARTELVGAVNGASLAATQIVEDATGLSYMKVWKTAPGARYPRHENYDGLDGQTVALDETFEVGDSELHFPGDPDGPPEEICNCRCTLIYTEAPVEAVPRGGVHEDAASPEAVQDVTAQASDGPPPELPSPALTPGGAPPDLISVGPGAPVAEQYRQQIAKLGLNQFPPAESAYAKQLLNGFVDTKTEFALPGGAWSEERLPLHKDIVNAHFEGKVLPPPGEKVAYFTAGGSASGKGSSLFSVNGKDVKLDDLIKQPDIVGINSDSIKAMLPEYKQLSSHGDVYAASAVHEESSDLAKIVYDKTLQDGYSFVYDSTAASGDSKFEATIQRARDAGYHVQVVMTSIPTNEAIVRSLARGDYNGRYVAIPALKEAHAGSARNFATWQTDPAIDYWRLYDNRVGQELVAEGGGGLGPKIYDKSKYNSILAKADEGLTVVPKDPILGITPFRVGEDNPLGFYSTQKAQQFEADLETVSQKYAVNITSADHVTGVWEDAVEPSYSVHAYDGPEGVQKFAEEMRARYDQDAVMVFTPQKALPTGAVADSVQYRISGIPDRPDASGAEVAALMNSHGLPGGTFIGHQIEIVGSEDDAAKVAALAHDLGGKVTLRRGQVEFIERPEVPSLGVLKAPDPASMIAAADAGAEGPPLGGLTRAERLAGQRRPLTVYQQQEYEATKVIADGLPNQGDDPQATIYEYANREFAKAEVTDHLDAALADNPAWVVPPAPKFVPVTELKVGDVIHTDSGTVRLTKIDRTEQRFGKPLAARWVNGEQRFYVEAPESVQIPGGGPEVHIAADTLLQRTTRDEAEAHAVLVPAGMVPARVAEVEDAIVFVPKDSLVKAETSEPGIQISGGIAMPDVGERANALYVHDYRDGSNATVLKLAPGDAYPFPQGQGGASLDPMIGKTPSKGAISGLVDTWAGTSADESPYSLALQKAVEDEFGIAEQATSVLEGRDPVALETADKIYEEKGAQLRAFVRAEYNQTQELLSNAGIKDVTLYRGFGLREIPDRVRAEIPMGASIQDITLQPASSFSASWNVAKNFTNGDSAIIGVQVPASRILSTPRTGIGALNEGEYVVLGPPEGLPDDQAYFHRFQGTYSISGNVAQFWQAGVSQASLKFGPLRQVRDWRSAGAPMANAVFKVEGSETLFKVKGAADNGGVAAWVLNPDGTVGGEFNLNKGINVQVAGEKGGLPDTPKWLYSPEVGGWQVDPGDTVALTPASIATFPSADHVPAEDTIFEVYKPTPATTSATPVPGVPTIVLAPKLKVIDAGSGTLQVGQTATIFDTTKMYPVAKKTAGAPVVPAAVQFKPGPMIAIAKTQVGDQVMLDAKTSQELNKLFGSDYTPDTVFEVTNTHEAGVDVAVIDHPGAALKGPTETFLKPGDLLYKALPVEPTVAIPTKSPWVVAEHTSDASALQVGDMFAISKGGPIWKVTGYEAGKFDTQVVDPNGITFFKKGETISNLSVTEPVYMVGHSTPDIPPVEWKIADNTEALSQFKPGDLYAASKTSVPIWKLVSKDNPDGYYTAEVVDSHGAHFPPGYVISGVSPTATMYKAEAIGAATKAVKPPAFTVGDMVTKTSLTEGDFVKPAPSWVKDMKAAYAGGSGFDATGATFTYTSTSAHPDYFYATTADPGSGDLKPGSTVLLPYAGTKTLKSKAKA